LTELVGDPFELLGLTVVVAHLDGTSAGSQPSGKSVIVTVKVIGKSGEQAFQVAAISMPKKEG
jgi:hypothetical protein